ncbi:tyrosine recombinase, partial [Klebsiella variicola]
TASNAARFAGIWERNNLLEEKGLPKENDLND